MSNYVYGAQQVTFGTRDGYAPGNAEKIIKGTQMDSEFARLATVSSEKLDFDGTNFQGTISNPAAIVDGGTF